MLELIAHNNTLKTKEGKIMVNRRLFAKKNQVIKKINRLDSALKVLSAELHDPKIEYQSLRKKKKVYNILTTRRNNLAKVLNSKT